MPVYQLSIRCVNHDRVVRVISMWISVFHVAHFGVSPILLNCQTMVTFEIKKNASVCVLRFRKLQAANETAKVGALALVKALSFDCFTINSGWTLGWSQHNKEFKFEARTDNCVFDLICRWGWTNKENGLLVVKTLDHYLHSSETVLAVLICVERKKRENEIVCVVLSSRLWCVRVERGHLY